MDTGEALLLGGAILGGALLLGKVAGGAAGVEAALGLRPSSATGPSPTPAIGGGATRPTNDIQTTLVTGVANFGGRVGQAVGTAVGSTYFGPAGKLVGVQAGIDTKSNILDTNKQVTTTANVLSGREGYVQGAKDIGATAVHTAVQPLKTTYHVIAGLFS